MTILELLTKAGAQAAALKELLETIVKEMPDLAPMAQRMLDELGAAASPAQLAETAIAITAELGQVAQLKFDGRTHAGDGA